MNKYQQAAKKLTASQKAAMNKEYQDHKAQGKLVFTSKVTGLDYTVSENVGRKSAPRGKAPATSNPMLELAGRKTEFSMDKPKDMVYEKPTGASTARLTELNAVFDQNSKENMDRVRRTPDNRPEIKPGNTSYKNTVPTVAGSTALARYASQQGNMLMDNVLGKVDKKLGTDLNHKEYFGQAMTEKDAPDSMKSLMYKMADEKASKGKLEGFISYEDLKNHVSKEDYEAAIKAKAGEYGKVKQTALALGSAGADYALTIGGARYKKNPKTGEITVSDSYDFLNSSNVNKDGSFKEDWVKVDKLKGSKKDFIKGHNKLSLYDLERQGKDGLANRSINFKLSPADTVGRGDKDKEASAIAKLLYKGK